MSKTSNFLQTPDQLTVSDHRGPSARYRAPSPQPPSAVGGAGGVAASQQLQQQDQQETQRPGSLYGGRITEDQISGQSRMSDHCGPRLIVFVVGGATWPEARVCYNITQRVFIHKFSH